MMFRTPFYEIRCFALRLRWRLRPPQVVLWGARQGRYGQIDYQVGSPHDRVRALRQDRAHARRLAAARMVRLSASFAALGQPIRDAAATMERSLRQFGQAFAVNREALAALEVPPDTVRPETRG